MSVNDIAAYMVDGFFGGQRRAFSESNITFNVSSLPASPRQYAMKALEAWSDATGIEFVETDGAARITFRQEGNVSATYFDIRGDQIWSADVVQSSWMTGVDWRKQVQSWIHEIGHALGAGHPGEYNGDADPHMRLFDDDETSTTVMSYFHVDQVVRTPQEADVQAIQMLYGDLGPLNVEDDSYLIRDDEHWHFVDDGGVDTIRAKSDGVFDMTPGASNALFSTDAGTVIENVTIDAGSDYSVEIIGNAADNVITIIG